MSQHAGKRQPDGRERLARVQDALKSANLDAVLCTLPSNVLMLSGYWPVIGTGMAVATADGINLLLAPQDELQFAEHGWASRIEAVPSSGSLSEITTPALAASGPLRTLMHDLKLECARIGYEYGEASEPASYAGMHVYNNAVIDMLRFAAPSAALAPANLSIHSPQRRPRQRSRAFVSLARSRPRPMFTVALNSTSVAPKPRSRPYTAPASACSGWGKKTFFVPTVSRGACPDPIQQKPAPRSPVRATVSCSMETWCSSTATPMSTATGPTSRARR